MNIRIILLILCLPMASQTTAQYAMPSVHELEFEEVALDYNTYNDKHEPMAYLSGFSIEGDIQLLKKNPVQVMFNPIAKVDRSECILMRWDPVMRVWNKLTGKQLKNTTEGRNIYWAAAIDSPGHFALMKKIEKTGKTQIVLPVGYSAEEWRYVQPNIGVVCEGFTHTRTLSVPLLSLSPVAHVSMKFRKVGEPACTISEAVLGNLVKDFWKEPDAINQTFEMSFASLK
jgi:hypothetical protein